MQQPAPGHQRHAQGGNRRNRAQAGERPGRQVLAQAFQPPTQGHLVITIALPVPEPPPAPFSAAFVGNPHGPQPSFAGFVRPRIQGVAERVDASGGRPRHQPLFRRPTLAVQQTGRRFLDWAGSLAAAAAPVFLLDPGHHVPVGEVSLEIRIGIQIAVARQHVPAQPVPAPGAEPSQGVITLTGRPGGEFSIGAAFEAVQGPIHIAQQQIEIGQQRLDAGPPAGDKALPGGRNPFGLALGEPRSCEGDGGQEIGGAGSLLRPAVEKIHLLLDGEKRADLLEEGLEVLGSKAVIGASLQPPGAAPVAQAG